MGWARGRWKYRSGHTLHRKWFGVNYMNESNSWFWNCDSRDNFYQNMKLIKCFTFWMRDGSIESSSDYWHDQNKILGQCSDQNFEFFCEKIQY